VSVLKSCFPGTRRGRIATLLAAVFVLTTGWPSLAQTSVEEGAAGVRSAPAVSTSGARARAIDEARKVCQGLHERLSLPGLSAAVAAGGEVVWAEGFGQADLENPTRVTPKTRFRIGSLSKLLTVAAVARLVDEGMLDLDEDVRTYVPYFPEKKWKLTTRQLCSHTAGIRHYGPKDGLEGNPRFETVKDGIAIFADDPLLFEPGTAHAYSSYGYNLVSAVVEGASGKGFLVYLDEAVCRPLGLFSTAADDNRAIVVHRAGFYHVNEDGSVINVPYVDNSYKWAGGGLLSSPTDLARLALAHLGPGFLSDKARREVFTPVPGARSSDYAVGLGWRVGKDADGRTLYHHGGSIAGGRAQIVVYPDQGVVAVLMANTFTRFGLDEARAVARGFLGEE